MTPRSGKRRVVGWVLEDELIWFGHKACGIEVYSSKEGLLFSRPNTISPIAVEVQIIPIKSRRKK